MRLREDWRLAEAASELALFLWFTAPATERAAAHREYVAALSAEEHLAAQLAAACVRDKWTAPGAEGVQYAM
jgi:hypothetical protein